MYGHFCVLHLHLTCLTCNENILTCFCICIGTSKVIHLHLHVIYIYILEIHFKPTWLLYQKPYITNNIGLEPQIQLFKIWLPLGCC